MKSKHILLLTHLVCASALPAAPVLIGGFHGENETAQQSLSISDVTVTLARTGASTDITQGTSQISSTVWGTQALDVAPGDSNLPGTHAIFQSATTTPITLVMTVTNNGTDDLLLDSMHWIVKKDIANAGPPSGTLTYTSGDLADANGTGTTFAIANGINGNDIDLSGFLTDTTLAAGQSAVFTWAHDAPENAGGNTALRLDNMAISGEVVSTGPDETAPTPNPMTWASVPAAASDSSITMTAVTATDESGVQYYFTETSGNAGGSDSGWQSSVTYTDTGLSPNTSYSYTVKARDTSAGLNETAVSTPVASATTLAADNAAPTPNPMTFDLAPTADGPYAISMAATTASDASDVEYYFTETSGNTGGSDSGWQDSTAYTDDGLEPETQYSYTVTARDKSIGQNQSAASTAANATTDAEPVGPVLLGGFDGSNAVDAPKQHSSAVGIVDMELSSEEATLNRGNFMQSSSLLWGTTDLDPDAENTGTHNVVIFHNGYTLSITATNTSADKDVTLETLHWISKRDLATSATHATITYTSGSLTDSLGTTTEYFLEGTGAKGHDFTLSDMMVDRVLAPGETATFTWTVAVGGAGIRLDNVAFSGTFADSDYISWSSQQSWTVGDAGTSGNDDYDGDGWSNDAERNFGLDPMDPQSRSPMVAPLDPADGSFSYTRRTQSMTGLHYPVWYSTDLAEWFRDFNATHTPGTPVNDVETVAVEINPVLLDEPRLFLRLGAEPPLMLPAPEFVNMVGSTNMVTINFSQQLYQLTATDIANYTVELDGGGAVTITEASLSDDKRTVSLTLDLPLSFDSTYNVNFSNLTGITGVPLAGSGTGQFDTWDDDPNGIKVFILAGQSNMVGYGMTENGNGGVVGAIGSLRYLAVNNGSYPEYDYTSLLETPTDPANSPWRNRSDVKVWGYNGHSGNHGGPLQKGDLGPPFTGGNTAWIGPEYAFGQVLGDFYSGVDEDVLIIKTAWGGHSLAGNFRPPSAVAARGGVIGESYLEAIDNIRQVLSNLGTEFPEWSGRGYQIVGVGWHQGVSDGSEPFATEYKDNLVDLISDLRAEFGKPALPFVIASTGMQGVGGTKPPQAYPYPDYTKVEKAQLWVAGVPQPANVLSNDTRYYWRESDVSPSTTSFHWNHNAESYFLVGKGMGDNMVSLLSP